MPFGGSKSHKKKRRRRSSAQHVFDEDHNRKRRSKNSGIRRLSHLSRKPDNEKIFWGSIGAVTLVVLAIIAIWQFVIVEHLARSEETENDYIQYQPSIPEVTGSAAE